MSISYYDKCHSSFLIYRNGCVCKKVKALENYINDLKASKNKLDCFGEGLFYALVDKVKVNKDNIAIIWKDGTES